MYDLSVMCLEMTWYLFSVSLVFCPSLISEKHRPVASRKNIMGTIKKYSDYLNMDNLIS